MVSCKGAIEFPIDGELINPGEQLPIGLETPLSTLCKNLLITSVEAKSTCNRFPLITQLLN